MPSQNSNPLTRIKDLKQLRLAPDHQIKPFNCGNNDLNEYFLQDAKEYQSLLYSVTYVLEVPGKTVAYYTLQNDKLKISPNSSRELKSVLRKKTKQNRSFYYKMLELHEYPAVKISRLAVDIDYQNMGLGTFLLDSITYSFLEANKTGCTFITVDAINNEDAIRFYTKNGFEILEIPTTRKDSILMYKNLIQLI